MIAYIKDEVLRAVKRKGTYGYIAGIVILCLLANLAMLAFRSIYGMNDGSHAYNLILFAEWVFVIPYYSTILIADIIFGKEYPNPHIKNKITAKLGRTKLYIGKLIAEVILSAILVVIAVVLFFCITLLMSSDGTIGLWTVVDFCEKVLIAVPLWVAGIAIANSMLFLFRDKKVAYGVFFGLVFLLPRLVMFLSSERMQIGLFVWIKKVILITPQFDELQYFYTLNIPHIIILGVVYTVLFTSLGIIGFRKKEF